MNNLLGCRGFYNLEFVMSQKLDQKRPSLKLFFIYIIKSVKIAYSSGKMFQVLAST